MLRRKYEKEISEYLERGGKALLVTGARQTGKTYLIRELCRRTGKVFVEFNLIDRPDIASMLKASKDANDVLLRLSFAVSTPLEPGNTIVFFDEVQEAGDIVTLIKFLVDEGSYQYVLSGSLLGVELQDIRSVPVGYMHIVEMFPMDFREFLWAIGVKEESIEILRKHYCEETPVDPFIHEKMRELYYRYLVIGGMPEAVRTYVETNDLKRVEEVHRDITALYKRDFTKYEKEDKLRLESIYDLIPSQLNKQNRRFVFTYLNKELKFDRYENSFLWLKDAGVAIPVYNAAVPALPLEQSKASNLFKLFMNDVGLLNSHYSTDVKLHILNMDGSVNNGALFENAAAQQLTANGLQLYYYKTVKAGEVDIITELDGKVLPIEVKSGSNYRTHSSLDKLLADPEYGIEKGIVLCDAELSRYGNVLYLPVYMSMFIENTKLESLIIPIDISGL